jgi:hypothetical protein
MKSAPLLLLLIAAPAAAHGWPSLGPDCAAEVCRARAEARLGCAELPVYIEYQRLSYNQQALTVYNQGLLAWPALPQPAVVPPRPAAVKPGENPTAPRANTATPRGDAATPGANTASPGNDSSESDGPPGRPGAPAVDRRGPGNDSSGSDGPPRVEPPAEDGPENPSR